MDVAILANDLQRDELSSRRIPEGVNINWFNSFEELISREADVYFDLLFERKKERIGSLLKLTPKIIILNAVTDTLQELGESFIRINGWPGFLKRNLIEVAINKPGLVKEAMSVFSGMNWPCKIVADQPGMISARIIAMIINEAYFASQEGVSTKPEIDIAMKSGTNYPYGPFEWCKLIGLKNIYDLLLRLSETDPRYKMAESLIADAENYSTA